MVNRQLAPSMQRCVSLILETHLCFFITVEGAYVEPMAWHLPGMDLGHLGEIVGKIAWRIIPTSVAEAVFDEREVGMVVNIEGGYRPFRDRLLWLLLHLQHQMVVVDFYHSSALQLP